MLSGRKDESLDDFRYGSGRKQDESLDDFRYEDSGEGIDQNYWRHNVADLGKMGRPNSRIALEIIFVGKSELVWSTFRFIRYLRVFSNVFSMPTCSILFSAVAFNT